MQPFHLSLMVGTPPPTEGRRSRQTAWKQRFTTLGVTIRAEQTNPKNTGRAQHSEIAKDGVSGSLPR